MTATASWTFHCDGCPAYATVAGTDLKEAENTLVSVLHWVAPGGNRHLCERHNEKEEA